MDIDKIKELEKQIEELKARWPAHSVPSWMYERLEELEEELDREKKFQEEN
ncbi:MAG: histidine kinase [Candidatus Omnitrophica bacterium]|nr:histidine kinase [Candidatus Omnitrophota bacterium]